MAIRLRTASSATLTVTQNVTGEKSGDVLRDLAEASPSGNKQQEGMIIRNKGFIQDNTMSQDNGQNQTLTFLRDATLSSTTEPRQYWNARTPIKVFQILARELSVLLILIETLILLGGYLMILAVHHSIRYGLRKLRRKTVDDVSYNLHHVRNYNPDVRPVPIRVPRGRMAGG